jgi:hypothetical protein
VSVEKPVVRPDLSVRDPASVEGLELVTSDLHLPHKEKSSNLIFGEPGLLVGTFLQGCHGFLESKGHLLRLAFKADSTVRRRLHMPGAGILELEGGDFECSQVEFGKFRQSFFSSRLLYAFAYEIDTLTNPGVDADNELFCGLCVRAALLPFSDPFLLGLD